jgi:hypothetical protein
MMDLDADKNALMARLKELQTQAVQLDNALAQVRQEIQKTVGVLEYIASKQSPPASAAPVPSPNEKKPRGVLAPSDG